MLNKLKRSKSQKSTSGFTIIEVMIVLAIAGLIMLIVFLAVPALQRASRNTSRKNDATSISSAISTFESNNNGAAPAGVNGASNVLTLCATGTGTSCSGNTETANLGYYTANNVTLEADGTFTAPSSGLTNDVFILTAASCNGASPASGDTRGIAVVYWVESGSSQSEECLAS